MDIDNLVNQFTNHLENKGRSQSTIVAYRKDIEQLLEHINELDSTLDLEGVKHEHLNSFVDNLKDSGQYTLKTVSRKINSLKTFFKYLKSQKLIVNDHSKDIKHPELLPQLPRVLSPLEYRALRDVARNNLRLYTMVELLLQTGIRIGELSRMKRDHVNIEHQEPHIYVEEYSSNPERIVHLNEIAHESLDRYLFKFSPPEKDKGYLFTTKTGNPVLIRNIRTAINRAFKKAGIKNATVNDIRNTFIVFQLEQGLDIELLAELAGHQKATTTERYLQLLENPPAKRTNKIKAL
ncbi:tyrosine-type recombinase/integrase [Candidatus Dojkabacteria bacterium]|uniref:Tyrosine-type recombinase/integrase n=1 Tax=Candidatus Dojkabacteria bacterium TaxID=2099670 RepID=A0A955RJR0_9BACT|nr:tyrosine-type recombinase/integrase [Candidatus Dojkabacteria bacterium]